MEPDNNNTAGFTLQATKAVSAIKILVSNNVAGGLIGKKGQMINEIQTRSGATVRISQTQEFFPDTQERTVLIFGDLGGVEIAQEYVLRRIYTDSCMCRAKPMVLTKKSPQSHQRQRNEQDGPETPIQGQATLESQPMQFEGHICEDNTIDPRSLGVQQPNMIVPDIPSDSGTLIESHIAVINNNNSGEQVEEVEGAQVSVPTPTTVSLATTEVSNTSGIMTCRLVIPAATAGLLIGRQGCNITRLKAETGIEQILIVNKANEDNYLLFSFERLANIRGSLESCIHVVNDILILFKANPIASKYQNMTTSYTRATIEGLGAVLAQVTSVTTSRVLSRNHSYDSSGGGGSGGGSFDDARGGGGKGGGKGRGSRGISLSLSAPLSNSPPEPYSSSFVQHSHSGPTPYNTFSPTSPHSPPPSLHFVHHHHYQQSHPLHSQQHLEYQPYQMTGQMYYSDLQLFQQQQQQQMSRQIFAQCPPPPALTPRITIPSYQSPHRGVFGGGYNPSSSPLVITGEGMLFDHPTVTTVDSGVHHIEEYNQREDSGASEVEVADDGEKLGRVGSAQDDDMLSTLTTLVLEIPDSAVARIVGSKGSGIRKLTRSSGCSKIKVSPRVEHEPNLARTVSCKGTPQAIAKAEELIKELINKTNK